jgi:hypothetical protein
MEKTSEWIQEWLALWPADVESGGQSIRSKPEQCVNKMQKLCKSDAALTKEVIFAATKLYLQERAENAYAYTKRATYFIHKLTEGSLLQTYCEKILSAGRQPQPLEGETPTYNPIDDYIN